MTALAIDPSEIKITDYKAIRARLMLGGAIPRPVLEALVARERAVEVREEKAAQAEAVLTALDKSVTAREACVRAELHRLAERERDLDRRERSMAVRLGEEAGASAPPPATTATVPGIVRPHLKAVLVAVARRWNVEVDDLASIRRTQKLVEPRRAFYALARQLTLRSIAEIGRMIDRDHTTALHHILRAEPVMAELRQTLTAGAGLDAWLEAYYRKVVG